VGRIADAFERARAENRAALVIYICAGDPDLRSTVDFVVTAADAGADVIELGVPFSDPTADGPAIQRAAERALRGGTTLRKVLRAVRDIRSRTDIPILLFGYYNPVLAYGEQKLVDDAADCGADGFLIVDMPPEESAGLRVPAVEKGLDFVPLVAPTSDPARIRRAAEAATSFIYYVSMTGVTGSLAADLAGAAKRAGALQQEVGRPVALGFGVKTRDDVSTVAPRVGGVVVGSAIVGAIERAADHDDAVSSVRALVSDLARGLSRQ
jgi:tryptophan synthase alpha chain